jgi:L-amino acid N-acyltransferase YncA
MAVEVREADVHDLPQIQAIFDFYVLNTVVSFLVQKPPPDYIKSRFQESRKRGLPYLVAVEADSGEVVGYTYASAFRGFMLGYGHSVEMTVFCHPNHRGKKIGDRLMGELLKALRSTKHISQEAGHEENVVEFAIKKVFAIMAVDETAPRGGLALRDWYVRWGFEEVGRLKGVGFKKDRM